MDKETSYKVTKKVKIAMLEDEVTQTDLANKMGISRAYLNSLLNNKAIWNFKLLKIAKLNLPSFEFDFNYFMNE